MDGADLAIAAPMAAFSHGVPRGRSGIRTLLRGRSVLRASEPLGLDATVAEELEAALGRR